MIRSPRELRALLEAMAEPSYREFSARLLPGVDSILGVRIPQLRKLARQLAQQITDSDNLQEWMSCLKDSSDESFEERLLQGLVIGYLKVTPEKRLELIAEFLPKVDNWSVCDSFCSGLKFTKQNKTLVWEFLQPYFYAAGEFEVRFAVVMLLDYYTEPAYLKPAFTQLAAISHQGYYVKMAVAWALSYFYLVDSQQVESFLKENGIDLWIRQKAVQKILESNRVSTEQKQRVRSLKQQLCQ